MSDKKKQCLFCGYSIVVAEDDKSAKWVETMKRHWEFHHEIFMKKIEIICVESP